MLHLQHRIRAVLSSLRTRRASGRRADPASADWLPPVLGPNDWSMGLMADRSAGWYFDRD